MEKMKPAASPDAYVSALRGWRRECVEGLRKAIRSAAPKASEEIKWGHIVWFADGPVVLVRAEPARVLLGFWRGKRLVELEPRLKPSGGYEMATVELREGDAPVSAASVKRIVKAAVALNAELGDPRDAAKKKTTKKKGAKKATAKKTPGAKRKSSRRG